MTTDKVKAVVNPHKLKDEIVVDIYCTYEKKPLQTQYIYKDKELETKVNIDLPATINGHKRFRISVFHSEFNGWKSFMWPMNALAGDDGIEVPVEVLNDNR